MSSFNVAASSSDFDKVCGFFAELNKNSSLKGKSATDQGEFITDKVIQQLGKKSNARASWMATAAAVADQRYELFKEGAESVLRKPWECAD